MMNSVDDIRNLFKSKLLNEKFTIDRTGQKTIECIGASFLADQPSIFGAPNKKYIAIATDNVKKNSNSYDIHVYNSESLTLI